MSRNSWKLLFGVVGDKSTSKRKFGTPPKGVANKRNTKLSKGTHSNAHSLNYHSMMDLEFSMVCIETRRCYIYFANAAPDRELVVCVGSQTFSE